MSSLTFGPSHFRTFALLPWRPAPTPPITDHRSPITDYRPFTLLEILLAVAIFALLMASVATGMFVIRNTWEKSHDHQTMLNERLTLERIFDSAVRNAVPFSWQDDDRKIRQIFVGTHDRVCFAYQHRVGASADGGLRFLSLELQEGKLIAIYRKTPFLPWKPEDANATREVLADGVASISFRYADIPNDKELEWVETWEDDNPNIPMAIQMMIRWENDDSETWLRRTAGNGIAETLGRRRTFNR